MDTSSSRWVGTRRILHMLRGFDYILDNVLMGSNVLTRMEDAKERDIGDK